MSKRKRIRRIILFVISLVLFLLYFFPFILVLINSLKERIDIVSNPLSIPSNLSLQNYTDAFETMNFMSALWNSLFVTILSLGIILIFSSLLAYFLVRWKWRMNGIIFTVLIASMIVPFQALMIPYVSIFGSIGILNSKWMLIFSYLGFGLPLATFMYHGFIKQIPVELEEAAVIDGASRFQVFRLVVLPMLKPVTATIAVLDVLWIWNDFLLPSLVLVDEGQRTIPLSTFYFFGQYTSNYGAAMAGLVLAIIPVVIFFLALQKQIIQGVVDGAIK